jgi:hypothetical protein
MHPVARIIKVVRIKPSLATIVQDIYYVLIIARHVSAYSMAILRRFLWATMSIDANRNPDSYLSRRSLWDRQALHHSTEPELPALTGSTLGRTAVSQAQQIDCI